MKIILVGQGPFGEKVLDTLIRQGEDIVGVFCPQDKRGQAMAATAENSGVALFRPAKMKDGEVREAYLDLSPDLAILAFVTDLIPEALLDIPPIGTICYHPSLLPRHRGASGINWAVIQGDTHTGLTILWVDKGIDTGPILLQKEVEILPDDTTGSIYFNKLFEMGIDAIVESVALIKSGKAPKLPQDDSLATYEPPCDDRVAAVDWSKPASDVYNLIRGCDPQPGAYSTIKGSKVRFYGARLLGPMAGTEPGEIVEIKEGGVVVALKGGALGIGKIRDQAGSKMGAGEFAKNAGLEPGMKFA
ncbi:MAG: methionyl-tRNA formyltransferase [Desulfobacteraceae bacterium]|jgi:methionyl-tRNA formyltransferase|nr:methionyl-tRNA formyltransferase [Desulfobacteraceae bacterium]